jgi:hypothetical protein
VAPEYRSSLASARGLLRRRSARRELGSTAVAPEYQHIDIRGAGVPDVALSVCGLPWHRSTEAPLPQRVDCCGAGVRTHSRAKPNTRPTPSDENVQDNAPGFLRPLTPAGEPTELHSRANKQTKCLANSSDRRQNKTPATKILPTRPFSNLILTTDCKLQHELN